MKSISTPYKIAQNIFGDPIPKFCVNIKSDRWCVRVCVSVCVCVCVCVCVGMCLLILVFNG